MATFQIFLPSTPYESFGTVLDSKSVQINFTWNERNLSYAVDIEDDNGEAYISGRRLVPYSPIDMKAISPSDFTGSLVLLPINDESSYSLVKNPEDVSAYYGLFYYSDL